MSGWLDKLSPAVRHALLVASGIVATALIQYVQANFTQWNLSPAIVSIIGFLIPMAINVLTPLTQQYGVGSPTVQPVPDQSVANDA